MPLTTEAKDFLAMIHRMDFLKILLQMKEIQKDKNHLQEFDSISEKDFDKMIVIMDKYYSCLKTLL